ncbi:unnamed protein product (mitochondrion) [Plasmodiophora brassicae]|uniref:Uncharacterized protein n=2 Tax=Plasmodiophora brassicae TaxID=37360 RepID=A0A3P3Y6Z3_PLABS|nr:unnamed protein product [Plasmodiophora brassicae]
MEDAAWTYGDETFVRHSACHRARPAGCVRPTAAGIVRPIIGRRRGSPIIRDVMLPSSCCIVLVGPGLSDRPVRLCRPTRSLSVRSLPVCSDLAWVDDENDVVAIGSDAELQQAAVDAQGQLTIYCGEYCRYRLRAESPDEPCSTIVLVGRSSMLYHWRLRNVGSASWPAGCRIVAEIGDTRQIIDVDVSPISVPANRCVDIRISRERIDGILDQAAFRVYLTDPSGRRIGEPLPIPS